MNILEKKNQLLSLMRRPQAQRKPTNFALWWAWLFYNLVALFLDIITAYTVLTLTNLMYAALTFFAGFMPLLMHEFLFMRAYASKFQRGLAMFGAGVSVFAIIVVGLAAGAVNVIGISGMANPVILELAVISLIVLISAFHGLLAAVYFYVDEGIRAKHNQAEAIAYHDQQLANINLALDLAEKVTSAAAKEDEFVSKFGDRDLLDEAMSQITGSVHTGQQTPTPPPAQPKLQQMSFSQAEPEKEVEFVPVPLAQTGFSSNGHGPQK